MSLIKGLYRHPKTKYIFGFGGPRDPDKKKRNPRHTLLKICLPLSFTLSLIKLIAPTATWIAQTTTPNFASLFLHYPSDDAFRSLFRAVLGLQMGYIPLVILQAWNFLVVWHRKDNTVRRSAALLVGDLLLVAVTAVNIQLVNSMRTAQPSKEEILEAFPDLDLDDGGRVILDRGVTHTFPSQARVMISLVCIDTAVHVAAIAFWHWLLPPVWRFPVHYEPLVQKRKNGKSSVVGGASEVELVGQLPAETSGGDMTLGSQFQEQETRRLRENRRRQSEVPDGTHEGVSAPLLRKDTGRQKRRNGTGPRLAPEVRYWAFGTGLFNFAMRPLCLWGLFSLIVETIIYALINAYDIQCEWYCHMRFVWILLVASTLAATVTLLRLRISLDYKVCNALRLDLVLLLIELPIGIAGAALHIHRLVEVIDYSYARPDGSPGFESAKQAARVLGMIVSLFWGFLTVAGTLMSLSQWKSYLRRRPTKMVQ